MSKEGEPSLQYDLFTGKLVDNRSAKQRRTAREQEGPEQATMFSQREMAQFGVDAHPKLPISPKTRLELMVEDHRTEGEKAADVQRQALEHNFKLFEEGSADLDEQEDSN